MKHFALIVACLGLLSPALHAEGTDAVIPLRNSSFEADSTSIHGWRKIGAPQSTARIVDGGRVGENCLAMTMAEGDRFVYVDQPTASPAKGDRFVISAYLRADKPIAAALVLENYFPKIKKETTARKAFQVTSQWQRYWAEVTIDREERCRSRVIVQIHTPGITVFVDGVQVERKREAGPSPWVAQPELVSVDDAFFPIDGAAFPEDDFDYSKYPAAITGYNGQDMQRIGFVTWGNARRRRVGPRGNYKAGFTQLPNGKLVLAACRKDAGAKVFGMHVYESSDLGDTWKQINKTPLFGKEPALAALADGTLIVTAQGLGTRPDGVPPGTYTFRSRDGGRTWEEIQVDEGESRYPYPRNIFVDMDGSLIYLRDDGIDMTLCRSVDGGKAWTFTLGKVDWAARDMQPGDVFAEIGVIRTKSDGRLLAVIRREIPGYSGEGFEDTFLTESADDGTSWSRPWRASGTAEVHGYLTELADGRLLMTYASYHLPYGPIAIVSSDGGKTFDRDNPIQLAISSNCYTGWPVTLQLEDGSLITSYATTIYAEKDPPRTVCEVVRWRLP